MNKEDKAIMECYNELFKNSDPSANFNDLLDNASINERGQKEIPFMDHSIEEDIYDNIVDTIIKKYKFSGMKKQQFKTTIALGCSPTFKKNLK